MQCERINFLGVPVDILKEEDIEQVILDLLDAKKVSHIVFLSTWDVLKGRDNKEFKKMLEEASLIIPISKSIIKGARFLKRPVPIRYSPFDAILSILNVINAHYKSLYLLGASKKSLTIAEDNVKSTFTELRFVGRYQGYYNRAIEPAIISAIVKAHPSLLLIGDGIKNGKCWTYKNKDILHDGIYVYEPNIIDIFSKYKRKTSEWLFKHGLEYLPKVLINPFRIFNIFKYIYFKFLLLFYRIRKK